MPQLHFSVSPQVARALEDKAKAHGTSLSRYLAELVQDTAGKGWPRGYFEQIAGAWEGEPVKRVPEGKLEQRDAIVTPKHGGRGSR